MITKNPQQELYSCLLERLRKNLIINIYDTTLPELDCEYPFIFLGDTQQVDEKRKGIITGRVIQNVHIWHNNPRQRGTLSEISQKVKEICRSLEGKTYHFDVVGLDERVLLDDSTDRTLLHGVLSIEFSFD